MDRSGQLSSAPVSPPTTVRPGGGPAPAGTPPLGFRPGPSDRSRRSERSPAGRTGEGPAPLRPRRAVDVRTVLLVEDDEKFAGLLARAFGHLGFTAVLAVTGDGALDAMRQDRPFAAVVLDIMIPHPDGIEVCHQLRRDGWAGPIVIISALDGSETRTRARGAGADVFLPKPFRLEELLDAVSTLVDGSPSRVLRDPP
jgi:CheY-like chemotaxis protein